MNDTWRSNYHSKSLRGKCRFVESRKGSTRFNPEKVVPDSNSAARL